MDGLKHVFGLGGIGGDMFSAGGGTPQRRATIFLVVVFFSC